MRRDTPSLKIPSFWGPTTVSFYEFDDKFNLVHQVECSVDNFYYCKLLNILYWYLGHDLAVTENYYIVHQTPFVNASLAYFAKVVSGFTAPGNMMKYHPQITSRLLLIPRNPTTEAIISPISFEILPCHMWMLTKKVIQSNSAVYVSMKTWLWSLKIIFGME